MSDASSTPKVEKRDIVAEARAIAEAQKATAGCYVYVSGDGYVYVPLRRGR